MYYRMKIAAALMCSTAMLLPGAASAQTTIQEQPCEILVSYLEENPGHEFPINVERAKQLREANNQQACRTSLDQVNAWVENQPEQNEQHQSGDTSSPAAGQILVQQRPPAIEIEQAAPQVTVQQAQPQVMVTQEQPEIFVRQPAPTITIDIPQPEITVRMPQPEVQVSEAPPQVQVQQQQPQVRVTQPEQPQVQVQRGEPNVQVQQQEQAKVQLQQSGEPNIRYEREEPRVVINQAEGEPRISVEQAGQQEQHLAGQQSAQQQGEQHQNQRPAQELAAGEAELRGTAPVDQTPSSRVGQQQATLQSKVTADNLIGSALLGANNDQIAEISDVVFSADGSVKAVIVDVGGFLGIGEKPVAIAIDRIEMQQQQEGELRLTVNMTEDELNNSPRYERQ